MDTSETTSRISSLEFTDLLAEKGYARLGPFSKEKIHSLNADTFRISSLITELALPWFYQDRSTIYAAIYCADDFGDGKKLICNLLGTERSEDIKSVLVEFATKNGLECEFILREEASLKASEIGDQTKWWVELFPYEFSIPDGAWRIF